MPPLIRHGNIDQLERLETLHVKATSELYGL